MSASRSQDVLYCERIWIVHLISARSRFYRKKLMNNCRSYLIAAGLGVSLLLAGTGHPANASSDVRPGVERLPADTAPPPADRTDVPLDDPRRFDDAADLPEREDSYALALQTFGDRFGGMWIDRSSSPSTMRVNVVKATAVDSVQLALVFASNQRVVINSVKFSSKQLDSFRQRVDASLGPMREHVVGTDVASNRIRVKVPRSATAASLEKTYSSAPPEAIEVTRDFEKPTGTTLGGRVGSESPGVVPGLSSTRTVYPNYYAGALLRIERPGGALAYCTTGFTMKSNSGGLAGLSSGHCSPGANNTNLVYIGSDSLGTIKGNTWLHPDATSQKNIPSDAMKFVVGSAVAGHAIYVTGSTSRLVQGQVNTVGLYQGDSYCFSGASSGEGERCGTIGTLVDTAISYLDNDGSSRRVQNLWEVAGTWTLPGDSGAPVYSRFGSKAIAAGIAQIRVGSYFYFNPIQQIQQDLSLAYVLSENFPS